MPGTKGIPRLILLTHHRWAIPVLAELRAAGGGTKFVTLANRLAVSRAGLRQTLDRLIELGWVMPNPGYGHPMRPEYILTEEGAAIAPACVRLAAVLRRLGVEEVARRKWSLPALAAIRGAADPAGGHGAGRFTSIRDRLAGVTDRALAMSLRELEGSGLVRRRIEAGYPPRPVYELTELARPLVPILARL